MNGSLASITLQLIYIFTSITVSDIVDIVLVAAVFFVAFQALHGTRALQLLRGVSVIAVLGAPLLILLPLNTFGWLVRGLLIGGVIALPLLFYDELKRALTGLGQIGRLRRYSSSFDRFKMTIVNAAGRLASQNEGALIVLEGSRPLDDIITTGIPIQAEYLTPELITSIFNPKSSLHDGAVVLSGDSLVAAGCILPLYTGETGDTHLGTRHRAALGLANKIPDALSIIISEETGRISVALDGRIYRGQSLVELEGWLDRFRDQLAGEHPSRFQWLLGGGLKSGLLNLVISIGLALVAWVSVVYQTNPPQQPIIDNIPLVVRAPDPGLVLMSQVPDTIRVQIQTSQDNLNEIDTDSMRAELALDDLPAGIHRIPVEVEIADRRAQVLSIEPPYVDSVLEPELVEIVTPTLVILDPETLPIGYAIGDVSMSPESVTLIGPQSYVEEVSEVQAQLILNGRNSGFQEILPLYLLDDAGQIVESDDLTLTPGEVLVTVPIKQTSLVREVPVQASLLSETLTPGYEINSVLVDPRTVTLTGTSLALESVGEFVETAPISLTNVLSEVTLDSPLVFPEGVVAMDDLGDRIFSVSVHITVSPVNDYLLLKIEPTLLGVPLTYTVSLSPKEVSVLLEGPQPLLDEIKDDPALVIVTLDLEGFSPGLYMVPVDVQVPSGVTVEILPTEVQVTIEEVVEP